MSVMIIAEAGVNHNGSLKLAKQMIEEAAKGRAELKHSSQRDNKPRDLEWERAQGIYTFERKLVKK